jgi:hypothetical protein
MFGAVMQILWEQCGDAIGVDVGKQVIEEASKSYPHVQYGVPLAMIDTCPPPQILDKISIFVALYAL